jgi:membrane protease YdiL (CAAX protease family)
LSRTPPAAILACVPDPSASTAPSRAGIALELAAVLVLAALFVAFFRVRAGYVDVALALAALGLIAASTRRTQALWSRLPRGAPAARNAWRDMGVFTGIVVGVLLVAGAWIGYSADGLAGAVRRVATWHFAVACVLYLPWALLQQFIFQVYLLGRLLWLAPYRLAVPLAALAFSMVHFPRTPVMLGTAAAGVIWAATYVRHRALLPLAVSHAVLGSALHYWVFGRDLARLWGAL